MIPDPRFSLQTAPSVWFVFHFTLSIVANIAYFLRLMTQKSAAQSSQSTTSKKARFSLTSPYFVFQNALLCSMGYSIVQLASIVTASFIRSKDDKVLFNLGYAHYSL